MPERLQVRGRPVKLPATPRREVRSDPQPALSVERSLVTRDAARWLVQPVAPPRDFCEDYSGARRPAMRINSLCNGV